MVIHLPKLLLVIITLIFPNFAFAYKPDLDLIQCEINPSDSCTDFLLQKSFGPRWIIVKDFYFEFVDKFKNNDRENFTKMFTYPLHVLVEKKLSLHPEDFKYEYNEYYFDKPEDLLKNYDIIFLEEAQADIEKHQYKRLSVIPDISNASIIGEFIEVTFIINCIQPKKPNTDSLNCDMDGIEANFLTILRKWPEAEI